MDTRTARCSCGQLSVTCSGEPIRTSICHCWECQRRTGSAFGAQARWTTENVVAEGRATEWVRIGDDGGRITFRFCPVCGSTVYYDIDTMPGMIAVPIGGFADTNLPKPVYSVYGTRKHPWVKLPEDIETMD
jgi:hypothetical protein